MRKPTPFNMYTMLGKSTRRGFTLLLAALISSIVLSVGAAIFSIAQKQLTLSAIGRDSQFAFYAADTAAECALYWDFRCNYFATSTSLITSSPSCNPSNPANLAPKCDTQLLSATGRPTSAPYYPYTMNSGQMNLFQDVTVPGSGNLCATVSVTKCQGTFDANSVCTVGSATDPVRTIIHADGYSTNCASISVSERALQRSVELRY